MSDRLTFDQPGAEGDGAGPGSAAPRARAPVPPAAPPVPPPAGSMPARAGYGGYGGSGYGYGGAVATDEVHLLDYVKVLYKRRWTAIAAFLLVVGSVTIYTFTATPIYEARIQILIEPENPNVVSFKEVLEQDKATNDYYQTQYKLLQSRVLARRTVQALNLWANPEFSPDKRVTSGALLLGPFKWLQSGFGTKPIEAPAPDETAAQSKVVDRFLKKLTVSPIRNSRLVDVKYESPSAETAATVVNALGKAYIEQNLEFKFLASKEASDWLGERMAEQRKQVEATEVALQKYREQNDALSLEERQNIVVQKLADLNAAVTRAKTERIQKEAFYNQVRSLQGDTNALDTFPTILSNTFIQQQKAELAELQRQRAELAEKLGDKHPDMVKVNSAIHNVELKIQAETQKVVQAIRNEYVAAQTQETSLMAALEQQKRDALELNRKGIDYGVLQRDAATNRTIFESLMQRTKETGISAELRANNLRIVDAAEVPRRPAYPDKTTNLLLALFGGATFAVGLAFFFEYLDNRIKSPQEIKTHLGLPFLGMIPAIDVNAGQSATIDNGVPQNFSEAFRAIRTNVLFSSAEEGTKTLVVTSTRPGEGKTIVASNLAIALAQVGQRVLLIDADMRKPRVHEVFGVDKAPGLSNLMVGNAKPSESVKKSAVANLWVLPAGVHPPNPAELLGSKRFKDLMTSLSGHFDWAIVDTPPVMPVTDASIVGHIATGVVFVVGAEMTSRNAAASAIEQLERSTTRTLGAVLNRVETARHGYYYSKYYDRSYSRYYERP